MTKSPTVTQALFEQARERLLSLARQIQLAVSRLALSPETLSGVAARAPSDILYRLDREVGHLLRAHFESWGDLGGVTITGEGFEQTSPSGHGPTPFPTGTLAQNAVFHILLDPVDGTRGLMWDKRPGFFLAALATGELPKNSSLAQFALVAELPTSKMFRVDLFHATRGSGAQGEWANLFTGSRGPRPPSPFPGGELEHGFAGLARYFAPNRKILAEIDDTLMETLVPAVNEGRPLVFEDQFITSGGQIFEMLCGKDRFVADLRGMVGKLGGDGPHRPMTCHPYDLALALVAEEAGVALTDARGHPLIFPWDTTSQVDYIAYANPTLKALIEPVLQKILRQKNLL